MSDTNIKVNLTRYERPEHIFPIVKYLQQASRVYFRKGELMDHNESLRKFEHLMLKQADHAREAAIELEALVSEMPSEKSRQLAELQVKASHKQAKEFRELAQKVHES
jgi:hypothetical protein